MQCTNFFILSIYGLGETPLIQLFPADILQIIFKCPTTELYGRFLQQEDNPG